MASNYTCKACLRALQRPSSSTFKSSIRASSRLQARQFHVSSSLSQTPNEKGKAPNTDPSHFLPLDESARSVRFVETDAPATDANAASQDSGILKFAKSIRKANRAGTETYVAYSSTQLIFRECSKWADYRIPQSELGGEDRENIPKTEEGEDLGVVAKEGTWWFNELKLPPTFSTWAHVTFLHMYIITTRLRHYAPKIAPTWHQHLTDHFFHSAEERMIKYHALASGTARTRYLKDLFVQWRGILASYDEGIVKGDAVLAAAIWRNVWKGREDVDVKGLTTVVSWMRREMGRLAECDDETLGLGLFEFQSPNGEEKGVLLESKMMREEGEREVEA